MYLHFKMVTNRLVSPKDIEGDGLENFITAI